LLAVEMMETTVEITVSLPRSVLVATGVRERDLDKFIREIVAVELYRQGRISLGKAAEVAGVDTKLDMMLLLAKHNVWTDYTAEDARDDITLLRDILRQ
jgi:predicted HTH domain antitoxin